MQRWQRREEQVSAGQAAPALGQLDSAWMPTPAPGSEATSDKSLLTLNLVFSFCKENRIYRDASLLGFKIIIFTGCEFYVSLPGAMIQDGLNSVFAV